MTFKYVRFNEGALLTGSAAIYYTVPTGWQAVIKKLTFCNVSGDDASLTVHLVASGGAVGPANILIDARQIAPGETFECFAATPHTLASGDTIRAFASAANAINIIASGMELQ
jgi:hypothetical protein